MTLNVCVKIIASCCCFLAVGWNDILSYFAFSNLCLSGVYYQYVLVLVGRTNVVKKIYHCGIAHVKIMDRYWLNADSFTSWYIQVLI